MHTHTQTRQQPLADDDTPHHTVILPTGSSTASCVDTKLESVQHRQTVPENCERGTAAAAWLTTFRSSADDL